MVTPASPAELPSAVLPPVIPSPPSWPFLGNLLELDGDALVQSLTRLSAEYGPIYRLTVLGASTLVLGGQALVAEACDETRFGKLVHSALVNLRPAIGDGLFTAHGHEANWARAHRILMPAFGPLGIREMAGKMLDIAHQMFERWERFGPDTPIDVADDMTRLTLDTLALCAFDLRFNSFYRDAMHPFVDAMVSALLEASARDRRPAFVTKAMRGTQRRFERDVAAMHKLADDLVAQRRREGRVGARGDLLDRMLAEVEGETLDDENIRYQLVTFLIAGHETTSGLLSFTIHLLLRNPDVLARAQAMVDARLGSRDPTLDDLGALRFIEQILMESLRLWPTAPAFAVTPHAPTLLGGTIPVEPGDELLVLLPALHRDPLVWGEDADSFRPERFDREAAAQLPPHAWKPFGNGQRACIGRGFAMQEAQLVLVMLLQRFDISAADGDYALKIAETLTIKPEGLRILARRRSPAPRTGTTAAPVAASAAPVARSDAPLLVLHGGNSGSCQAFARRLANDAAARGRPVQVLTLDAATHALPAQGEVLVVTASYEGLPADNARRFIAWLGDMAPGSLAGLRFAVLGCGNRQWARTYQAMPRKVDEGLAAAGASRIVARGEADAAGDFIDAAERWMAGLWQALDGSGREPAAMRYPQAQILPPADEALAPEERGHCLSRRELAPAMAEGDAKYHVELALPPGATYRPGDTLLVWPRNPPETVARALARLGLDGAARIALDPDDAALMPFACEHPLTLETVLSDLVELERPVTRDQLRLLAAHAQCPPEQAWIAGLMEADAPTIGTLSLLEGLPSCAVPLGALLSVLPPILPRRYSLASSPETRPGTCALTVSVVDRPSWHGPHRHRGVGSTYLAGLAPGAPVRMQVQPGSPGFRLPDDPTRPVVMIAAGSGIAPFRGFIEERIRQRAQGIPVGPMVLYFGCRDPAIDWLYRDELSAFHEDGLIDLRMVFSRAPVDGLRHVQHRIAQDGASWRALLAAGAHVYLCGDAARLVPGVEAELIAQFARETGRSQALARRWAQRFLIGRGRYAVDAFA